MNQPAIDLEHQILFVVIKPVHFLDVYCAEVITHFGELKQLFFQKHQACQIASSDYSSAFRPSLPFDEETIKILIHKYIYKKLP